MGVMEAPEKEKDTLGTLNTEEGVRGASLDALGNAEGLEGAPEPRFTRKAVMGASSPCQGMLGQWLAGINYAWDSDHTEVEALDESLLISKAFPCHFSAVMIFPRNLANKIDTGMPIH